MCTIYRSLRPADFPAVKQLINESFALHTYIENESVLKCCLDAYLQSCLAEATFSCVAERSGVVIGVIMGKADSDDRLLPHVKPFLALAYHTLCMSLNALRAQCDLRDYRHLHRIYEELSASYPQRFDGVLTLFAVAGDCRGLGVGKQLLGRLLAYQKEHGVTSIYLYTDTTCNVGFYDRHGFVPLARQTMRVRRNHAYEEITVFLYGYRPAIGRDGGQ
ncbi:GNAT family N-acetyltransferase [Oscillibacter sp.]|uniref:GNAT family N-acetyltransferase n=1 Tax=Oscillibacter sp. TaxID=1945593 RepID=UPI0026211821|nr:GNAT family N-acetyltransferase [Oscillibacter sp.]MDD3346670.1 GNAT family N-acetyltransferase [Oscillibacter sp.]